MSKFENAFSSFAGNSTQQDADYVKIDWAKVNQERADLFDTKDKAKSRVGIISGIIDLGLQPMEDGRMEWKGTPEEEAIELEKNPTNYFDDYTDPVTEITKRCKFWKQKPQRAIAITADFPQFQYDWGGEIGKKPFRFLLNGEFIHKGMKRGDILLGRTYDLKETTKDFAPRWSLAKNSLPHKMAVATNIIKPDEPFTKKDLGKLIGKAALFEVRFWLDDGYANEKISFKGEVPEGMSIPAVDEDTLYYINLDAENDEAAVKQLRKSVKNTIKLSESYVGSKLQEQYGSLIEGTPQKASTGAAESDKQEGNTSVTPEANVATVNVQDSTGGTGAGDDTIPF